MPVLIQNLGEIEYEQALQLQRSLHQTLVEGTGCDTVLLCTHPPVITCGTSTDPAHLPLTAEQLSAQGLRLHTVERGGSVTYHGPEQLVCYPLLDLRRYKRDVGWYMRSLEEVILRTLTEYGVPGVRIPGKAGVWIDEHRKVAFAGVRISRWCTRHGFALNVYRCDHRFRLINPCGLGDIQVVSLEELSSFPVRFDDVSARVAHHCGEVFQPLEHGAPP
jgi:lipoyl(octanoyl) transferase